MNKRIPERYTLLIACSGRAPITLTFQPWLVLSVLLVSAALPAVWISQQFSTFAQRNLLLAQKNSLLTEQAQEILQQVEALEAEIDGLQERAGIEKPAASASSAKPESERSRGGAGFPVDAETLLRVAQAQLPDLHQNLQGEVQPALEKTLRREDARPKGVPIKAGSEISSEFGLRRNPFGGGYELHEGLDFTAAYGTPVYATAPGRVVTAGWSAGGYGYHVIVDHGYGYRTLYAHMTKVEVAVGDRIQRDRLVGYLGNTGRSSGPHLHYGVYYKAQPIDPKNYLR